MGTLESSESQRQKYKERKLNKKCEKNGQDSGKHVISLHFTGISHLTKFKDMQKLQQDIENDPIIRDQMVNLGCHFVLYFVNFYAPVLFPAGAVTVLDLDNDLKMKVMKILYLVFMLRCKAILRWKIFA